MCLQQVYQSVNVQEARFDMAYKLISCYKQQDSVNSAT